MPPSETGTGTPLRVALVGYMRSGKDSVAAALMSFLNSTEKISFARALKEEVCTSLNATLVPGAVPFTVERLEDDRARAVFRPLLQWWGTEYRRSQDPDHWVKIVEQEIAAHPDQSYVCTDGRFINELRMLRNNGFQIYELRMRTEDVAEYLARQGLDRQQIAQQMSHPSELEWQSFAKDASFQSEFGNLPSLTAAVVSRLEGDMPVSTERRRELERFFASMYPATYGDLR